MLTGLTPVSDATSPVTLTIPESDVDGHILIALDNNKSLTGVFAGGGINQLGGFPLASTISGKKFYISEYELFHTLWSDFDVRLEYSTLFYIRWIPNPASSYTDDQLKALLTGLTPVSDATSPVTLTIPTHNMNDYILIALDNNKSLIGLYDGDTAEGINQLGGFPLAATVSGRRFYISEFQQLYEFSSGFNITLKYSTPDN